jgi:hypothetical protein
LVETSLEHFKERAFAFLRFGVSGGVVVEVAGTRRAAF